MASVVMPRRLLPVLSRSILFPVPGPSTHLRAIPRPSFTYSHLRPFHNSLRILHEDSAATASTGTAKLQLTDKDGKPLQPRLSLTFTCTVTDCGHRSRHEFSRHSYEKGIVIVQCPGCKNRHLIADHLSWFKDDGQARTVEDMVREHGGRIRTGYTTLDGEGAETIEIESDSGGEEGGEDAGFERLGDGQAAKHSGGDVPNR